MNYLVFDTETTGFPLRDKPADYPGQARIVQLACVLIDEQFKERAIFKTLIKPDGWTISPGAQNVHGISVEECEAFGMPIEYALKSFEMFESLEPCRVAHNIKFDNQMLNLEFDLMGLNRLMHLDEFCTMQETTELCKIPSARGGYKWPKLHEAYEFLFGEKLDGAHDALIDVRACARIFRKLKEQEAVV